MTLLGPTPTRTKARAVRHGRAPARAAARLARHPRALGLLAAALLAGIAYVILLSVQGVPFEHRHRLLVDVPAGAPPLQAGDQVRIGGQRAGIVKTTKPLPDHAQITVQLSSRFWPLGTGTSADVRLKIGTGLTYVELRPGGRGELREGATIPLKRTLAGVTLPQVAEAFDASTRRALANTTAVTGAAVTGEGNDLNHSIADLRAALDDGVPVLHALTARPGELSGLIRGSGNLARDLSGNGSDLGDLVHNGSVVATALADKSDAIGTAIDAAPGIEAKVDALAPGLNATLESTNRLVQDLRPGLNDLNDALPYVQRVLAAGPQLRSSSVRLAPPALTFLRAAPATLRALLPPVIMLKPLAQSLDSVGALLDPYRGDMLAGVRGLAAVTSKPYSEGATASGNPALRFAPVLDCHRSRDPYPAPGQALHDKAPEGMAC
jgi:phospholipid/cholesterol/gamma-HCH transport system substrate-binding protein